MKLSPVGSKILVKLVQGEKEKDTGGFMVVEDDKPYYSKGSVVECDPDIVMESYLGHIVVFPTELGKVVGLGLSKDLVLVDVEDIHGVITEEGD